MWRSVFLAALLVFAPVPGKAALGDAGQDTSYVTEQDLLKYDFSKEELAERVLDYALPAGMKELPADGALLHRYARIYMHTGSPEKARALVAQIQTMPTRNLLLEIFAGEMMEDIAAGRDDKVFDRLENLTPVYARIETVDDTGLKRLPQPFRRDGIRDPAHSFCRLAATAYAEKGRIDLIEKIARLPECARNAAAAERYAVQSLIANGRYSEAVPRLLEMDAIAKGYIPRGHSFEHVTRQKGAMEPNYASRSFTFEGDLAACLPKDDGQTIQPRADQRETLAKAAALAPVAASDAVNFLLSRFLSAAGYYPEAEEAALKISIPEIRNRAATFLFEHYFLAGDEEATWRVANLIGMFDDAPLEVGGWGMRDPSQWYNVVVPGARVLSEKRGPLALRLAIAFSNARTRFTALERLASRDYREGALPGFAGCEDGLSCYLAPMTLIAENEKDAAARDYMYARLAALERQHGDTEAADRFQEKIVKPDRMICHYDMCTNAATGPVKPDCGKILAGSEAEQLEVLQALHVATEGQKILSLYEGDKGDPDAERKNRAPEWEKRRAADELATCQISSGTYRQYVAEPAKLGPLAKDYLKYVADTHMMREDYLAAVTTAAALPDRKDRYEVISGYAARLSNKQRKPQFDQLLTAMDATAAIRNDYTFWWHFLEKITREPPISPLALALSGEPTGLAGTGTWERASQILADRPDVRAAFLRYPAYLVHNLCPLLSDALPGHGGFTGFNGASRPQRETVFQSCPMKLVAARKFREALYLTQNLFQNAEMNYRIQLAILEARLQAESLPYRQSSLVRIKLRSDGDEDVAVERGFMYLEQKDASQSFTRSYESPYKCIVTSSRP
ncbi:MAG TPA: hypothetical protein VEF76_01725 [Patescibacteria group bacterium]|nr:hypothetical protein [Patescibacteria group bacterium]